MWRKEWLAGDREVLMSDDDLFVTLIRMGLSDLSDAVFHANDAYASQ